VALNFAVCIWQKEISGISTTITELEKMQGQQTESHVMVLIQRIVKLSNGPIKAS
jgi:hypothetical protein